MDWNTLGILVTAVIVPITLGTTWINTRLSGVNKNIFEVRDQVLQKLEYHEQHDDRRFDDVTKDIWLLRLRNAAIDGIHNGTDPKNQSRNVRRATSSSGESRS